MRFSESREVSAVLYTMPENLISTITGMDSDIYELIWLGHGMMIDTTELYTLILV